MRGDMLKRAQQGILVVVGDSAEVSARGAMPYDMCSITVEPETNLVRIRIW